MNRRTMISRVRLVVLPIFLFATGCASSVNTAQREHPRADPNVVADQRIVTDGKLDKVAQVIQIREAYTAAGRLRVEADVRNFTRKPHDIAYRVTFFDAAGMSQSPIAPGWRQRRIEGGQTVSLAATAVEDDATDFRLELLRR